LLLYEKWYRRERGGKKGKFTHEKWYRERGGKNQTKKLEREELTEQRR
jgi:hypothetical protein